MARSQVSVDEYREGARNANAVAALYSLRGLRALARYLHQHGMLSYAELFRRFVAFWKGRPTHPWSVFCEGSIAAIENAEFSNYGELARRILHADREAFDELLEAFVTAQDFWADRRARFFYEIDLLNRPYVYSNTPILPKRHVFEHLIVEGVLPGGYLVEIAEPYREHLADHVALESCDPTTGRFDVVCRRTQMPFMAQKSWHDNLMYCNGVVHRPRTLMPLWRGAHQAVAA